MYASQKARKLGIFSSLVAIVVCIVLITGSTFSLFTGGTNADISISAGQIKVEANIENLKLSSLGVEQTGGKFANGGTAKLEGNQLDLSNVTPGDRAEFDITVKNTSSVSISYAITWAIAGDLADYLTVTVDDAPFEKGTTDWNDWLLENKDRNVKHTVAIELPKNINNDAMGLSATIDFDLAAVQYNAIDETVESADQLELAINSLDGAKLEDNIVVPEGEQIVIPENKEFTIDLNGYTITSEDGESPIVNNGELTIIGETASYALVKRAASEKTVSTITANGASAIVNNGIAYIEGVTIIGNNAKDVAPVIVNNGEMTISNTTIKNTAVNGDSAIENYADLTLNGVTVIGAPMDETGYPDYAIVNAGELEITDSNVTSDRGAIRNNGTANLVINSGNFIVTDAADGRNMTLHTIYGYGSSTVTIYDGNFEMNHTSTSGASVICPYGATIYIYGGNFRDAMDDSTWTSTGNFQNYMGMSARPYVYGGSFDDTTVNKWVADGYTVSTLNGINYVVKSTDKVVEGANGEAITVPEEVEDVLTETEEKTVQQALNEAVAAGKSIYIAEAGTYTIPNVNNKALTIAGSKDVVIARAVGSYAGSEITFNGVSISCSNAGYIGFYDVKDEIYVNCTISGQPFLYGQNVSFTGCTFEQDGIGQYNVWTYTAKNVTFDGCVFNCADRSVLIYSEGGATANGPQTVTFNGCKFNSETACEGKAAIEIGTSAEHNTVNVIINDCTVNGFALGSVSEDYLYNPKNGDKHNIVLDGVTIVGTGLGKDSDGNYYVYNATGLKNLKSWIDANIARGLWGKTYYIMADIDATDVEWAGIWLSPDSSVAKGFTFDGKGHTISNLTIVPGKNGASALFAGATQGGNSDVPTTFTNLTFDNLTVNGANNYHVGSVWGAAYGDITLDGVNVINSKISGGCNVSALVGRNDTGDHTIIFKDCSVKNTSVEAIRVADRCGASAFLGMALKTPAITVTVVFEGNNVAEGNTLTSVEGLVGGGIYAIANYGEETWNTPIAVDDFTNYTNK